MAIGESIRYQTEQIEHKNLSRYASFSDETRGRVIAEEECDIRPAYQRDRDRILHCKSFRRMKHKTQVFLEPKGDHYRTRLTHTLEVSQIGRTIAKALRLNEDLVEAIALGHDLGHTPFGHAGEEILNRLIPGGFVHSEQSVRIVERLEKEGRGLNLTWEVRDGIRNHQTSMSPSTVEGQVVRLSDKIAYIHHDMDDAIRAKILSEEDVPLEIRRTLGFNTRERINCIIHDIINESDNKPQIALTDEIGQAMRELRSFMFKNVYYNPVAKQEEEKAKTLIAGLYEYYREHFELLPPLYHELVKEGECVDRVTGDYIAGMTDQYAISRYEEIFIPKAWNI